MSERTTTATEQLLYKAVKYTLDRQQTDADFGYYCGPLTATFDYLCDAEAAYLNQTREDVRGVRSQNLASREPLVLQLLRKVEELEKALEVARV